MQRSIVIRPLQAQITRNVEGVLEKMDPYIVFKLGTQKHKTHVCKNGGKQPTWTDTLTFDNIENESFVLFEVMDDNLFKDEVIGSGSLQLSSLQQMSTSPQWVPFFHKGNTAGQILMEIQTQGMEMPMTYGMSGASGIPTAGTYGSYGMKSGESGMGSMQMQPGMHMQPGMQTQPGQPGMQSQPGMQYGMGGQFSGNQTGYNPYK